MSTYTEKVYDTSMSIAQHTTQQTAIVIFGGTGNLAETKLFPALFHLYVQKLLPSAFVIIGLSRKTFTDEQYCVYVRESLQKNMPAQSEETLSAFCTHIHYASGSFDDADTYVQIKDRLNRFDEAVGQCTSKLFYLAVPPNLYGTIFDKLKESDAMALCDGVGSWSRLLVEKPFGTDTKTAEVLEAQLCALFAEEQIYRIDHYLAKDAIENIMSLRFANSILADSWNGTKIEDITIRLFESQDVSTRGSFYDKIGALRDVGQNHMLQMLALLTMLQADVHSSQSVRARRLEALTSLRMHDTDVRVRGQYAGYRETEGVNALSDTETYFKIQTHIDSELWKDVQVTLESGKALAETCTEAVVTFRAVDMCSCGAEETPHVHRNTLHITFSPEQSIKLTMWVKKPEFGFTLTPQSLVLMNDEGEEFRSPEAYERVLYDCIVGDQTRFVSGAEVRASWNFITPILDSFHTLPLHTYPKGGDVSNIGINNIAV